MKPDLSYLAARRQLEAMGARVFEVGIRDKAGRMLIRSWALEKVLEALAWLKRENALGSDIYVRPAGDVSAGIVLVDDLTRGALERMRADGLAPACVVETSPGNMQAWIRVSDAPLDPEVATEVAKMLATEYGGDPNSADWRHFGRLAGLTNQKPHHRDGALRLLGLDPQLPHAPTQSRPCGVGSGEGAWRSGNFKVTLFEKMIRSEGL